MFDQTRVEEQIDALRAILEFAKEYSQKTGKGDYFTWGWAGETLRGLLEDLKNLQEEEDETELIAWGLMINGKSSWQYVSSGEIGSPSYSEMMIPGSYEEESE